MSESNSVLPPAAEWDFRAITEAELPGVIWYEQARSCRWLRSALEEWHQLLIPHDSQGRVVADLLKETWTQTEVGFLNQTIPPALSGLIEEQPAFIRCFPNPFLELGAKQRALIVEQGAEPYVPQPLRVLSQGSPSLPAQSRWQDANFRKEKEEAGISLLLLACDFGFSKTVLMQEFGKLVDSFPARPVKRYPSKIGKSGQAPFHELKELTAYRLSVEAGLSYPAAQKLLEKELKKLRLISSAVQKIWPVYKSAGAWSDAANAAKNKIQSRFPKPT